MSRFFGVNVVRPDRITSIKPTLTEPSEQLRQCIRDAKIESLYGLLDENWETTSHQLVTKYWEPK